MKANIRDFVKYKTAQYMKTVLKDLLHMGNSRYYQINNDLNDKNGKPYGQIPDAVIKANDAAKILVNKEMKEWKEENRHMFIENYSMPSYSEITVLIVELLGNRYKYSKQEFEDGIVSLNPAQFDDIAKLYKTANTIIKEIEELDYSEFRTQKRLIVKSEFSHLVSEKQQEIEYKHKYYKQSALNKMYNVRPNNRISVKGVDASNAYYSITNKLDKDWKGLLGDIIE